MHSPRRFECLQRGSPRLHLRIATRGVGSSPVGLAPRFHAANVVSSVGQSNLVPQLWPPRLSIDVGFGRHRLNRSRFTRDRASGVGCLSSWARPQGRKLQPQHSSNVGRPAVQARRLVRLQGSTGVSRPCTSTDSKRAADCGGSEFRFLSLREFEESRFPRHPGESQALIWNHHASHRAWTTSRRKASGRFKRVAARLLDWNGQRFQVS